MQSEYQRAQLHCQTSSGYNDPSQGLQGLGYPASQFKARSYGFKRAGAGLFSTHHSHIYILTGDSLSKFIFPGTRGQVPILWPEWTSPDIGCFSTPFFLALAFKSPSCISKEDTSPMRHHDSTFLYDTTLSCTSRGLHRISLTCSLACYRHHHRPIYTAYMFQIGSQTAGHSLYTSP
jgi:hypothetical protein